MAEMVQIRSVKQYFKEFIVEGLLNNPTGHQKELVRHQLLDTFRQEIFGQIAFKFGQEVSNKNKDEIAKLEWVQNILHNAFRKWRRLCILCADAGIRNFIQLEDLRKVLDDDEEEDAHVLESQGGETVESEGDGETEEHSA